MGVTSGASTPTQVTNEVINYLEQYDPNDPDTWEPKRVLDLSRILPEPVKLKQRQTPSLPINKGFYTFANFQRPFLNRR